MTEAADARGVAAFRRLLSLATVNFKRLRSSAVLRKLAHNTGWQVTDKVLRMIVSLLVGLWVARYLGPTSFGQLNFAIAFALLFTPIADIGLQAIVMREIVRSPADRARIIASAIVLRLVGAAAANLVAWACMLALRPGDAHSLLMVAAVSLSLLPQAFDIIEFDYQARMQSAPPALVRIASLLLFVVLRIWLVTSGASVVWFATVVTGEAAVSAVVFWTLARAGSLRISAADRAQMLELLRSSWPLAVSSLSVLLYMRIDQVMLGQWAGNEAVGVFSAAVRISESWYFVPMAILSAVAPVLTAAHSQANGNYEQKLRLVVCGMLWFSIVVALVFTLNADRLIGFLYGSRYDGAAPVLALHAWAGVFACLGVATGPWFVNAGLVRHRMLNTMIGTAVNIGLNSYMIPKYGAIGAAVSTLVSYSLAALWLNAATRLTRPIFLIQLKSIVPI